MRFPPIAPVALFTAGCASLAPCGFAERDLVGAWRHVSGPSFFQEIAFELSPDGPRFQSWLHERPEYSEVPWSVETCTLRITPEGDPSPWAFGEVRVRGSTLLLRETAESEPWVFERIP